MLRGLPMPASKVSLKLFIHKSTNQVIYAEAGKEFVEFFFNILRLPVGTLTTLLKPDIMFGHLGNINDSIINLSPSFGSLMRSELIYYSPNGPNGVKEGLYLVKNDMEVNRLSTASIIPLLTEFHVKDGDLEEKVVDVGKDEGLKLLKATLQSKNVLTDVFLPTVKPEV